MDATEPLVYVASEVEGEEWVEARVVSRSADGTVTLETLESKETRTQPADRLLLANTLTGDGVENMTRLNYLHEPALLANLRHRFERDHVYTYTGKICIAVNPFNWQVSKPLYEEAVLVRYLRQRLGELPPHVYAIAEEAYQQIRDGAAGPSNQSVLVSGESGAGKTESVKIMMQYLATVSKSGDHNKVARQVLATNPLLEAFGNARTLRNDNSSRFGKFIEIQFDESRRMSGARIHIYLLEKTRVIAQAGGERNFHIFYQLLRGLTPDERRASHLTIPLEELRLVGRSGCVDIPGVDDGAQLMRTLDAMEAVALSAAEQEQVLRALAAVLLLAQVELDQGADEHAAVGAGSVRLLEQAAELVGIDAAELSHALCTRRLVTRDDEVTVRLNREQADDSRDALAKALYGKLFGWLVERCNAKLSDEQTACSFIGILDIFGFEQFAVNSFEQLCINYANERLQQQFNWDIFKAEQAEYAAEGIEWAGIDFVDNQRCLDLIDRKEAMGLLHLLDEECAIQRGTDDKFAQKARERHASHADFEAPKRDQLSFSIRHYAGAVTYLCTGFRDKNKDTLHQDLGALMQTSASALVLALFPTDAPPAPHGARRAKGKGSDKMTTGSQFMTQLASLMRTINATDVHYVRCVKPNTLSQPALFQVTHVAHQLRCAGVLEAVRISRMAYPNRMPHAAFVLRYALLLGRDWQAGHAEQLAAARQAPPGDEAARRLCEGALAATVDDPARYQLGKTKVFFRAFLLEALEQRRGTALAARAVVVQKTLRAALWSRRFRRIRQAAIRLQAGGRRRAARSAFEQQRAAATAIGAASRGLGARRLRRRLGAAVRVEAAGRALLARRRTVRLRRAGAAIRLQSAARRHASDARFGAMRAAALRLQSRWRTLWQRRGYLRELAERKEEAKLSTQLARVQAQLQAAIEAKQAAEGEQERLRAERQAAGPAAPAVAPPDGAPSAGQVQPACEPSQGGESSQPGTIRSRLAGAAATYLLSSMGGSSAASMEETSSMLSLVTKDRERLGQRLAAEQEARKRVEAEKRELERRLKMGSTTSQVETRKTRDTAEALARKKEEVGEMRDMMQHQTIEMTNLQNAKAALERRVLGLEKKVSQYDDSFYALEARNRRDKSRMEEMAKAKNHAEEERSIYRLMLEQAHERWLKERHELRKDAQERLERGAAQLQEERARIVELEQRVRTLAQEAEENKMFKEQCSVYIERLSTLGSAGGGPPPPTPSPPAKPTRSTLSPGSSVLERMKAGVTSIAASGARSAAAEPAGNPAERR